MGWYPYFVFLIALLWVFAAPRDRRALLVVLCASVGSLALTELITVHILSAWKLVIPGAVETATILCLLKFSPNRSGYLQICCLLVAWFAHLMCFVDVMVGSDFIYSKYVAVIGLVALAQIACFHETFIWNGRILWDWVAELRRGRAGGVCITGHASSLLRSKGDSSL